MTPIRDDPELSAQEATLQQGFRANWWRYIAGYDAAIAEVPLVGRVARTATVATR